MVEYIGKLLDKILKRELGPEAKNFVNHRFVKPDLVTAKNLSTARARMVYTEPVKDIWARGRIKGVRWGKILKGIIIDGQLC